MNCNTGKLKNRKGEVSPYKFHLINGKEMLELDQQFAVPSKVLEPRH